MLFPHVRPTAYVVLCALTLTGCGAAGRGGEVPLVQAGDQVVVGPPARLGVDGPVPTTGLDTPASLWTTGPVATITTAELMTAGTAPNPRRLTLVRPVKVRPDRAALLDNPFAPAVGQWPPSPALSLVGPGAAFTTATPNVDVATLADTFALPPDTQGDAGPTQYLVGLNGRLRTINKGTGLADGVLNVDSDAFFAAARNGAVTTDPRVRFDRRSGRWFVLMITIAVPNRYVLAVSNTATITPATVWSQYFWTNTRTQGGVGGGASCLGDYPTLGVDEDALYIGVNQFCGGNINALTFDSTSAFVLNRQNLVAGSPTLGQFDAVLPSGTSPGPYAPQGVDNFDSGTNEGYVIGVDALQFGLLVVRRISNPAGTPTLSGNLNVTVPATAFPTTVPHPGSAIPLDGLDDRLLNAVIRNGRLWTSHQLQVNNSGAASAAGGRNGTRWYQLQNLATTPALVQAGTVFDPASSNPVHHWMSSIMVNGQGHAAMGMSRGGATSFVNTEYTGRLSSDAPGTMDTPTQYSANSSVAYTVQTSGASQRWGDYSHTSVDPNDDMTMWTLQEYPNAPGSYAVRLVRLRAPAPAAIQSLSPNSVAAGQTGVAITVTGSSSSGSGFFDPGAGFASRIAAAFSGSGVTVTGITVNSPTSLTLVIDTTGASAGARTLTVTNPDGQQAALASALTITGSGPTPPVAVNDSYNTAFNTQLVVAAPGVLANDNASGGGAMTAVLDTTTSGGTLSLNANGSFTFTPAAGVSGPTAFTYHATNANGASNIATATITVAAGGGPIVTQHPASPTVFVGQAALFRVGLSGTPAPACQWQLSTDLGASWSNVTNGGAYAGATSYILRVSAVTLAMSSQQFRCVATNANGTTTSNAATLSVAVVAPGPPLAGAWSGQTQQAQNMSFTVNAGTGQGNLTNLSYGSHDGCIQSTVNYPIPVGIANNAFTHASSGIGVCTTATRTITGTFGNATTASGLVVHDYPIIPPFGCNCFGTFYIEWSTSTGAATAPQIAVAPSNQSPGAGQAARFTAAATGTPLPAYQWQYSTNGGSTFANVPAGPPFSGATTPTLTIVSTGVPGLHGALFRVTAQNGSGTATSAAALLGSPSSPAPVAAADGYTTGHGAAITVPAPGVLGNDNSNGGGAMTAALATNPANGTVSLASSGGFTYTPNAGFAGSDAFTYRASTVSGGMSAPATVTIAVAAAGTPVAPSSFRITAMTGPTVTLAWTLPASGPAPTSLQLEGGLTPGSFLGAVPLGVTPSITITLPGGSFYLRMRSNANGVFSAPSNEILAHVDVPVVPSAPANLLGLVVGDALALSWTPTFGGGAPTGTMLDVGGAIVASLPLGNIDTFQFAGVPPGVYTFSVRQTNAGGASVPSNPVTLTFPGGCSGPPQPPANFAAFKSAGILSLSWDPPVSGTAPTAYLLHVTGSFAGTLPMAARSLSVPGPPGTFNLSVTAANACGASAPSPVQTVSFP